MREIDTVSIWAASNREQIRAFYCCHKKSTTAKRADLLSADNTQNASIGIFNKTVQVATGEAQRDAHHVRFATNPSSGLIDPFKATAENNGDRELDGVKAVHLGKKAYTVNDANGEN